MDVRPLLNRWSDAGQRWTDSSIKELVARAPRAPSRRGPLIGMFAAGLLVGAFGAFALASRAHIARLAGEIFMDDEADELDVTDGQPASYTSHRPNRTNHRRKAEVEVS